MLDRIAETTRIFEAWSDEPWVNEGAAVRVSLICNGDRPGAQFDGRIVDAINADLTASGTGADEKQGVNLTLAKPLGENKKTAYLGIQKTGPFDIPGELARQWLGLPNPHGKPNTVVVKPWFNACRYT